ncbi:MAG: peptidase M75, Imelysin [Rhizobiaceae bacterium]|nr:peptidase M75, Imelysin [Rhizobiaceae bacterium]
MFRYLILGLGLGAATAAGAADDGARAVQHAVDNFVRPAYVSLLANASAQREAMETLCTTPSKADLEMARGRFRMAVETLSATEIIRFGPISEDNRLERQLFWPDRKGAGLRQVQAAIAEKDPSVTDAKVLAGKSVAMQGFGALEFVLFGTGSDELAGKEAAHRCAYGVAIAENLEHIASSVSSNWSSAHGFAETWTEPGNDIYRDEQEALTELLEVFVNGLELVRDVRLNGFLGTEPAGDKARSALFWRSDLTADSLAGNLEALHALFDASQLGDMLPTDMEWLPQSIDFEFKNAARAITALEGKPIADVLADPQMRGKLDYLRVVTTSLSDLIGRQFAGQLGITAGFSSLDGD